MLFMPPGHSRGGHIALPVCMYIRPILGYMCCIINTSHSILSTDLKFCTTVTDTENIAEMIAEFFTFTGVELCQFLGCKMGGDRGCVLQIHSFSSLTYFGHFRTFYCIDDIL